jgi:hypothetical protein
VSERDPGFAAAVRDGLVSADRAATTADHRRMTSGWIDVHAAGRRGESRIGTTRLIDPGLATGTGGRASGGLDPPAA